MVLSIMKTIIPLLSIRIVFSKPVYIILAGVISIGFWILFSVFDQLLFFLPVLVFYLPDDAITGFILSNVTAVIMGIVISMNAYMIKQSKLKLKISKSLFSGSTIGILSSICASCSSLGFLLISIFGGLGVVASNFLSIYQIPLRLISIGILIWALYSIHKWITKGRCNLNGLDSRQNNTNRRNIDKSMM
jgi:hypothetical protein